MLLLLPILKSWPPLRHHRDSPRGQPMWKDGPPALLRGATQAPAVHPIWAMLNAGEERDAAKPGTGISRLSLLHSNKISGNSWHYQLTTGSCHLPLLNKLDYRSTWSTSKPPACPIYRTLQKHQNPSAYHQFTPKTSKYFSQIASFHEVFLLKSTSNICAS